MLPTSGHAPKLYLLDVEGTVAPMSLVSEQLFPYARSHFEEFLHESLAGCAQVSSEPSAAAEGTVSWDLAMLKRENRVESDPEAPRILPPEAAHVGAGAMSPADGIPRVLAYVFWLMDRDRKSTALKSLQGKIWKAGFESGELQGTLFSDVPEAFVRWARKSQIAIYSSGSVEAQRLLFRHSVFGDLTGFISNYFDTHLGTKGEPTSYRAIADALYVQTAEVLFFSDAVRELDAARAAGCGTRLVIREGNAPIAGGHGHAVVESFAGL